MNAEEDEDIEDDSSTIDVNLDINIELLDDEINKKNKLYKKNRNNIYFHDNKNKSNSILQEFNFFSQNSIKIQNKIKEIPFYSTQFHCFYEYSFVDFNEINKDTIEKHDINKKYILIKYLKKNSNHLYFNNYFFSDNLDSLKSLNIYIKKLLETYHYLLKSMIQLDKINICYFNLNPILKLNLNLNSENIYFNEKMELIIQNFEKSIDYSKKPFFFDIIKIIESLINENVNMMYFPIEVFIIHYLIKNDIFSLSFSIIQEISIEIEKMYSNNNFFLTINDNKNENISINIYNDVSSLLSPLINKRKHEIIEKLTEFIYTWDNYCLSLLYIKMINNIIKNLRYDTKYHFLSKWMFLLKKNISNNPLKRENLENTLEEYLSFIEKI